MGDALPLYNPVTRVAEEWGFEIAFGENGETQCGEGALQDGVGGSFTDAGAKIGLPFYKQREQLRRGEMIPVDDPNVEDGVGEIVAKFGVGGGEVGAEFLGEGKGGLALRDGVFVFGDVAPELALVGG